MIKELSFMFLRVTLLPFLIREFIQRKRITILLYHDLEPEIAEKHFKMLKNRYNIISLRDYVNARKIGKVNELPLKSLIITFDDGFKNNYKLKPIFRKYNIPVTIFLCSRIVCSNRHFWFKHKVDSQKIVELKQISDKKRLEYLAKLGFKEEKEFQNRQALSLDEIEDLKNIVDFQSHTMFHPFLPKCSRDKAFKEIFQSKKDLEDNLGLSIYAISYPDGYYSYREISIARKVGYECGLTVDLGLNTQETDIFRLKRIGIKNNSRNNELLVKACGLWGYIKKIFKGNSHG